MSELVKSLSKLQGKMEQPKKSTDNTFFKSRYADLTACFAAIKPHLAEAGLAFTQEPEVTDTGAILLRSTLRHVSGETITSVYPVHPVKPDPQALGSAITYARRYALNAMFGIAPEGEDDDGNAATANVAPVAKKPTPAEKAREAADGYMARIAKAKTPEDADAVLAECEKGKLSAMFPELFAEVVEEHKAHIALLNRKGA